MTVVSRNESELSVMKAARFLVLGVALAAGGAAAFLIGPRETKSEAPRATTKIGMLSLALRSPFDARTITQGETGRSTASAPFALVSATHDA